MIDGLCVETSSFGRPCCYRLEERFIILRVRTARTIYVYDAMGNQQIEQSAVGSRTTTTWNYENQPSVYRLPAGGRVTMQYNGDNRRVRLDE